MEFENIKNDFPETPQEIKDLIREEVEKQLRYEQPKRKGRKTIRRTAALALAAVLLCGLTAFAADLFRMQLERIGKHGIRIAVTGTGNAEQAADTESIVIPQMRMEAAYLPEGMIRTGRGTYSYENARNQGGLNITFYRMDTGDDTFELQHADVLFSEEFTAGTYQGVYLEYPDLYQDEITFNKRIYIAYTDLHYVMEMYAASDVSKEDALKVAENISLIPSESTDSGELVVAQDWSSRQEDSENVSEGEECRIITAVASEDMNIYSTDDCFPVNNQGLTARVSDIKITDDIRLLDPAFIDEALKEEVDDSGTFRPATIQYLKKGSLDSLSQEIRSRQIPQKLVYATVEYTNTGKNEMTNVLFFGSLVRIREIDGQMQMVTEEQPAGGDEWDTAVHHGLSDSREMIYYDIRGGERDNNYIPCIRPGETATVHMAWLVTEEELETLYISLDPSGSGYEFCDSSLKIGYVDIRP